MQILIPILYMSSLFGKDCLLMYLRAVKQEICQDRQEMICFIIISKVLFSQNPVFLVKNSKVT